MVTGALSRIDWRILVIHAVVLSLDQIRYRNIEKEISQYQVIVITHCIQSQDDPITAQMTVDKAIEMVFILPGLPVRRND